MELTFKINIDRCPMRKLQSSILIPHSLKLSGIKKSWKEESLLPDWGPLGELIYVSSTLSAALISLFQPQQAALLVPQVQA